MINDKTLDEVRRLLALGRLSQREIARQTGVSRGTVNAIANARWKKRPSREANDETDHLFKGPIVRCPTCGGRVYMPCMLCHIRDLKTAEAEQRHHEAAHGRNTNRSFATVAEVASRLRQSASGKLGEVDPRR